MPTDLHDSNDDDWRGITSWELSIKLEQLTRKTNNVTVILDCCHSAQMSRTGLLARALPNPVRAGFDRHLDALRARYGTRFDAVDPVGNSKAVRLVACGQSESSFEYCGTDNRFRGVFTEALVEVLRDIGNAQVSWLAINDAIRGRVQRDHPFQRPAVEGPARRHLFSTTEADERTSVAVTARGERFELSAGTLTGVRRGDVYRVIPAGSIAADERRMLAELEVVEVFAMTALAKAIGRRDAIRDGAPRDAVAVAWRRQLAQRAVALDVATTAREAVERAIAAAPTLRVAQPGELPVVATLRLTPDGLTIDDAGGLRRRPVAFPAGLATQVATLVDLGVAQDLRDLEGEHGVQAAELAVEFGIVEAGQPYRLSHHGSEFGLGDRCYVSVKNCSHRPLFLHVFSIGIDGKVMLQTHFARTGARLDRGTHPMILGQRADGALIGIGHHWPEELPRDGSPRLEEIVVIATTTSVDLTCFETKPVATRDDGIRLQCLLVQLHSQRYRGTRDSGHGGFLVHRISYRLYPRDRIGGAVEPPARHIGGQCDVR